MYIAQTFDLLRVCLYHCVFVYSLLVIALLFGLLVVGLAFHILYILNMLKFYFLKVFKAPVHDFREMGSAMWNADDMHEFKIFL